MSQKLLGLISTTTGTLLKKLVPWSVLFLIFGTVIVLFFGSISSTLKCQRPKSAKLSCQLSRTFLFHSNNIVLDRLLKASIHVSKSKDTDGSDSESYRIVLHTTSGLVFFTTYGSSFINKEDVYKINSFIENPTQTSLVIQEDMRWFAYGFGGFLVFLGTIGIMYSLLLQTKNYEN
jgi:hypothetical protein